ncbi:MAG: hypothetical protein WCI72_05955 [archaeon]
MNELEVAASIYEQGADLMRDKIRSTCSSLEKADLLRKLGELRNYQFEQLKEPRAKRLSENCYRAAQLFNPMSKYSSIPDNPSSN